LHSIDQAHAGAVDLGCSPNSLNDWGPLLEIVQAMQEALFEDMPVAEDKNEKVCLNVRKSP